MVWSLPPKAPPTSAQWATTLSTALSAAFFETSVATLAAACCGDWTPITSSSLRAPLSYQARPASGSMNTWSIDWVWKLRSSTSRSGLLAAISARIWSP